MKCFGLLLVFSVLAILSVSVQSQERPEEVTKIIAECTAQENLSDADKQALQNHNLDNASDNLKCFFKCFIEKHTELKDNQRDFIRDMLIKKYGQDNIKEVGKICRFDEKIDNCETAHMLHKCLNDNSVFI